MGWYLDTTRIFLTDALEEDKASIARLNPLGGGTIHHYWGWEEPTLKLKAYVVGTTDKNAISDMRKGGDLHNLIGSGFSNSEWNWNLPGYVQNVSWDISKSIAQTLRPDLPCNSIVFIADIEFYVEE
jgi:hypothetical protein